VKGVATGQGATRPGLSPGGFARAAVLIGAITVVARAIGFGRQLVFAHTVRAGCLGSAYTTANMVPNIVYDVVLGGALTAVVVPVLAGPAPEGTVDPDGQRARQTSAALLTWTVLLLAPASVLVAVIARPVSSVLLGGTGQCPRAAMVTTASHLLIVFAPQILLYGLAVVLYGIVQAHRRFTAPALAPVLSSLVVIGTYFWFGAAYGRYAGDVAALPSGGWILLAAGTTLGVAALVVTPLLPVARLGVRLRPTLRFPDGAAARVRSLAAAGIATLIAQDASVVVVLVLANSRGVTGALVLYSYAWAIFFLPYAVLAVPIATSAFPELSALAHVPDRFNEVSARSVRATLVASGLGVAALAGVCVPLAKVFATHQPAYAGQLAVALALFAPGLFGYGLVAVLSRALYATGRSRDAAAAAAAVCGGWLAVIVADLLIVPFVPASWVVPALGAGTSAGLCLGCGALMLLVRRACGGSALRSWGRAGLAGLAGATAGGLAGWGVSLAVPATGFLANVAVTALAGLAAVAAFVPVVAWLDGGDLRPVLRRPVLRRVVSWRR